MPRNRGLPCYTRQDRFHVFRMEAEWARPALVCYTPVAVDYIKPIGPAGVGGFSGVPDVIDEGRNLDVQIPDARARYSFALLQALRICEYDVLADIRFHLPEIAGVGFLDVNDIERRPILVLLVQPVERGNLPAKGRSGIAAEDKDHRFCAVERSEREFTFLVQ